MNTIHKLHINIISYFNNKLYNSIHNLLLQKYRVFRFFKNTKPRYLAIKKITTECLRKLFSYRFLNIETKLYETHILNTKDILEVVLNDINTQIKVIDSKPYFERGVSGEPFTPTPSPAPPPPSSKQRVVGYITSWDHYSHGVYSWTDEVANMITHVNYAFATISYSHSQDSYYVDMADPWADSGDCAGAAKCWGQVPECLKFININKEVKSCGSDTSPTVNMAPYIGYIDGSVCQTDCYNEGGEPISTRNPQCSANLNTFTHPYSTDPNNYYAPSIPTVCGMYNQLLNHKTGVRAKWPHLKFIISIGGTYDSNYFSIAIQEKYLDNFTDSIIQFVATFDFDGVDIMWNYPGFERGSEPVYQKPKIGDPNSITNCVKNPTNCQEITRKDDKAKFTTFITTLSNKFDKLEIKTKKKYIISIAGPITKDKMDNIDISTICKNITYVNIMTLDMNTDHHGIELINSTENTVKTNHQSPIYCTDSPLPCNSLDSIIQLYKDYCNTEQLNIGIPFYAHQYNNVNSENNGLYQDSSGPSKLVCETKAEECVPSWRYSKKWINNMKWDPKAKASYAYDDINKIFYSFDNEQSIKEKYKYIQDNSLGGFMYWYIGGEASNNILLKAINNKPSSILETNNLPIKNHFHYLTTLKDVPNIQLINGIKAYKYGITLQSYRYNR